MKVPGKIEDLAPRLAEKDDLPGYVYDLDGFDAHVARIRAALPDGVEFYYAAKANPDPVVLRTVARHVDGFEVASGGELRHVSDAVPGRPVAFGGPGKTADELRAAVRARAVVHVESVHELLMLDAVAGARGADVLLRVNLDVLGADEGDLRMGGNENPFGINVWDLSACVRLIAGTGLRLRGLHAHLASGLGVRAALEVAGRVLRFAREWCARAGVRRPVITVGGGMAVDYRDPAAIFDWEAYGRGLAALARSGEAVPGETLRIEPGRAVSAYCGWYVTRVLDVKRGFAVVAGGTHHLRTPAAKGHNQPFAVLPHDAWPHPWSRDAITDAPVTVVGQLCTPKDVLAREVRVGRVRTGDIVAFGMAGAYAWNISHSRFLMHPEPGFHYLGETEARLERHEGMRARSGNS